MIETVRENRNGLGEIEMGSVLYLGMEDDHARELDKRLLLIEEVFCTLAWRMTMHSFSYPAAK